MEAVEQFRTLEILKEARARIGNALSAWDAPGDVYFNFSAWSSCTCGHIYAAALGIEGMPDEGGEVKHCVDEGYRAALKAITRLKPDLRPGSLTVHLTDFVSDMTEDYAQRQPPSYNDRLRPAALEMLDEAIAMTEAELEEARVKIDNAIEAIETEQEQARELVAAGV